MDHWAHTSNLSASAVTEDRFAETASFILSAKGGSIRASAEYLRKVLSLIEPPAAKGSSTTAPPAIAPMAGVSGSHQPQQPPYGTRQTFHGQASSSPSGHRTQQFMGTNMQFPVTHSAIPSQNSRNAADIPSVQVFGDALDMKVSSLIMLVPSKSHVIGHIIGKGGSEVSQIETLTGSTVKILGSRSHRPDMLEKQVCILGTIAANLKAQQLISRRVTEKIPIEADSLRILVPSDSVRHIVGKHGANVHKLQRDSGANIQIVPEGLNPTAGRCINIVGPPNRRAMAQYLISRQVAEERKFRTDWHCEVPQLQVQLRLNPQFAHQVKHLDQARSASLRPAQGYHAQTTASLPAPGSGSPSPAVGSSDVAHTIKVPNVAVAYLIGKNGATIDDMERHSGAKIKIKPRDGGSPLREVTIIGKYVCVEHAKRIIATKLVQYGESNLYNLKSQSRPRAEAEKDLPSSVAFENNAEDAQWLSSFHMMHQKTNSGDRDRFSLPNISAPNTEDTISTALGFVTLSPPKLDISKMLSVGEYEDEDASSETLSSGRNSPQQSAIYRSLGL